MKMKKVKNKKNLVAVLAVAGLLFITAGVSYAFFSYSRNGTTSNTMETGVIKFIYNESTRVGNGISLTDAMPMPDSVGKTQDKYFDFSVTGTSGTSRIDYEITARKTATSDDIGQYVKLYLTKVNGNNEEQKVLSMYNSLTNSTNAIALINNEKTLYQGSIAPGSENYTENYRLRMWLNDNTTDGSVLEYTQTETGICSDDTYDNEADCVAANKNWTRTAVPMTAKTFTVKVNVYANGELATSQELADANSAGIRSITVNNSEADIETDETENYDYLLITSATSATIEVATANNDASVTIEPYTPTGMNVIQKLSTTRTVTLNDGNNFFKITVTSANRKETEEYILKIIKKESINIFGKAYEVIPTTPSLNDVDNTNNTGKVYKSTATTNGQPTYYFRGAVDDNYVTFAGQTWRIVRINEDGTIRMISNSNISSAYYNMNYGRNKMYYSNTDEGYTKTAVNNWYNGLSEENKGKIQTGNYFCEGAYVRPTDHHNPVQGTMTIYDQYTPTFACPVDGNNMQYVNAGAGLITYDEVVYAGGYPSKSSSFYLNNGAKWSTMSPAGWNSKDASAASIWYSDSGTLYWYTVNVSYGIRPVINLKSNVTATGLGTSASPWVIQ